MEGTLWIILGTQEISDEHPPVAFFAGVFDNYIAAEKALEKLNKNDAKYEIRRVECNKTYDYEWSNMDEDDYYNVIRPLHK